jgi:hypothetical protein
MPVAVRRAHGGQKPPLVWEGQISQQRALNVCAQVRAFRIWICSGFNLCPSTPTSLISRGARSAKLLRGRVSGANRLDGSLLSIFCMHKQHGRNFSGAGNLANSTACACLCASYRDRPQCDVFESLLSWPT